MTCIVGLEKDGKVYMGGDSAAVAGWHDMGVRPAKVFRRGQFLIGYTTSFRMGQLLQYRLEVAERERFSPTTNMEYMVTQFVPAIRELFKQGGYASIHDSQESGGQFLVGYYHQLFLISGDFAVIRSREDFAAVGCGTEFAIGAMSANLHLGPKARIKNALKITARHSGGVSGPFTVMSMKS
jgi:ATP-dependent protease HslVU (ClpYQ) peptidase subunit